MTDDTMPFLAALLKHGGGDFMKELAEEVLQRLMAYDIDGRIGAGRYERNEERTTPGAWDEEIDDGLVLALTRRKTFAPTKT